MLSVELSHGISEYLKLTSLSGRNILLILNFSEISPKLGNHLVLQSIFNLQANDVLDVLEEI